MAPGLAGGVGYRASKTFKTHSKFFGDILWYFFIDHGTGALGHGAPPFFENKEMWLFSLGVCPFGP